jgi:hypothetical protein
MSYENIGFANIRLPQANKSYIYQYRSGVNEFPEEVFVHEFLHTLERLAEENSFNYMALHSNEQYGYKTQRKIGLKDWYKAYLNNGVSSSATSLANEVLFMQAPLEGDFENSSIVDFVNEPTNHFEEVVQTAVELKDIVCSYIIHLKNRVFSK